MLPHLVTHRDTVSLRVPSYSIHTGHKGLMPCVSHHGVKQITLHPGARSCRRNVRHGAEDEYQDQIKAHKKTASQEKNWVTWPDYEAMVKRMAREVKFRGILRRTRSRSSRTTLDGMSPAEDEVSVASLSGLTWPVSFMVWYSPRVPGYP
jgi:hypothetical protein